MFESMRWFGKNDPISLSDIRQCGASGVVTALHHVPWDEAWSAEETQALAQQISAAGLKWIVAESIPVHDEIKRGGPRSAEMTDVWIESLRALAAAQVPIVCYNFMPVLDWTRTELDHPLANGATALRFDATAFAAFDLHLLKRPGAQSEYSQERQDQASSFMDTLDDAQAERLIQSVIAGLPGGMSGDHDLDSLRATIECYEGISHEMLLENIITFQRRVSQEAERLGVRLAIHPDDPPRPLLGLPRTVSSRSDFKAMFSEAPSPANGMTWCLGSLSAGAVPGDALRIGADHAKRIYFAHLRVVEQDASDPESFQEAAHLEGAVPLVQAVEMILHEEQARGETIPMRPDHGWRMLDDLNRQTNPGYGLLGRMRGLAEMRGVAAGLTHRLNARINSTAEKAHHMDQS